MKQLELTNSELKWIIEDVQADFNELSPLAPSKKHVQTLLNKLLSIYERDTNLCYRISRVQTI